MQATIARWGNSLGVRIPKARAQRLGLAEGVCVELQAEGDHLTIPVPRPRYRLEDLLAGMTPEAMGEAFDWRPDLGPTDPFGAIG